MAKAAQLPQEEQLSLVLEPARPKYDAPLYDRSLLLVMFALIVAGLVIISSASMPVADRLMDNPFHFTIRHGIYLVLSMIAAIVTLQWPVDWWKRYSPFLLLSGMFLLLVVLLAGHTVNGSTRWLKLGPITIQAAEPAKLFFFCYLASYLVRKHDEVKENLKGFIKPLIVLFVLAILLLLQPDLGTVIVMFSTTVGMLFLAGAKLWQFFALIMTGVTAIVILIVTAEYRMKRLLSFMNPWEDPFGAGYQLTQSLMAYGRGDFFGQGLGNSVLKLEYLPEAHTDFIFAIWAEEMGFVGVVALLALLLAVVVKAMKLGNKALKQDKPYHGFLANGMGIWIGFQTAVNVGVSSGVLPTKGLTLPFISYGGNSLIMMTVAVCILIRIDFELRMAKRQATGGLKA